MDATTLEITTLEKTATMAPDEGSLYATRSQAVFVASVLIIIGLLGLLGNLMVFLAVSLSRSLQDTTHVFVVSLAISDFITSLALLFEGISVLSETGWPFGSDLCKLSGALLILTVPTSIVTLNAIAINRYVLITRSKTLFLKIYTRTHVAVMVAITWIVPFLVIVVPQLIPATGGLEYDPKSRFCSWDLEHNLLEVFRIILLVGSICCSILIIFCYMAILLFVRKQIKSTKDRWRTSDVDTNKTKTPPSRLSKKQIDITINLAIVVVVFFICLLPYSINLASYEDTLVTTLLYLLLTLSTCINPVLYAVKHPTFKAVFKCMVSCRFKDIPHPSAWLKNVIKAPRPKPSEPTDTPSTDL
nr:melatonin receptor type 1B-A-like [Lytechinus pictus]